MAQKQRTIKSPVTLSGSGLHTGENVTLTFKPAPDGHGYKFQRIDMEGKPIVNADIDNVVSTLRGTNIGQEKACINTVEHALAALAGLEIDNVLMEINGPEVPIMDGSSAVFVEALTEAGIKEQQSEREYYELQKVVSHINREGQAEIIAIPGDSFKVTVMIDYNSHVLGKQHATLANISRFKDEISTSRTFVFLHELEELVNKNLIKGGDLNNAIVVVDKVIDEKKLKKLAEFFHKPNVSVRKEGILNNVKLKYQNEPARHKLLDMIGDLALIGMPIHANIIATRPGHTANIEFAKKIKKLIINKKLEKTTPFIDINKPPLFDICQIKKILPHRYPMLLIDKVLEMSQTHVVGIKNVTVNEPFFKGHFPDNPIMPGVLQVEAMAQVGGVLVLNTVPDPENYLTYFLKIDNVRFKNKVVPGDTLVFKLHLISPIRRGICHMKGVAYVRDKIVMEGELMAQIVKQDNRNLANANIRKKIFEV